METGIQAFPCETKRKTVVPMLGCSLTRGYLGVVLPELGGECETTSTDSESFRYLMFVAPRQEGKQANVVPV